MRTDSCREQVKQQLLQLLNMMASTQAIMLVYAPGELKAINWCTHTAQKLHFLIKNTDSDDFLSVATGHLQWDAGLLVRSMNRVHWWHDVSWQSVETPPYLGPYNDVLVKEFENSVRLWEQLKQTFDLRVPAWDKQEHPWSSAVA